MIKEIIILQEDDESLEAAKTVSSASLLARFPAIRHIGGSRCETQNASGLVLTFSCPS